MTRRIVLYGTEGCVLNKFGKLAERFCETLELPEEAVPGNAKVSMTGGKKLLIENHKGLLSYSDTAIEVLTGEGKISVLGSGFTIRAMKEGNMLIFGRLQSVEWCG